jgi:hypothetical protein
MIPIHLRERSLATMGMLSNAVTALTPATMWTAFTPQIGQELKGQSNRYSNGFSVSRRNGGYNVWSRKRPELPMHGAITVVSLLEFNLVPAGRLKFTACPAMLISPPITERVSCVHLLPDAQPPYQA